MKTALIGLDYIIDIMHPEGKIAHSAAQAAERRIVTQFNHALKWGHEHGWLTILVKVGFEPGYVDQPKGSPLFGHLHELNALNLAAGGTAFHPDIQVTLVDLVVTKPRVSAFYNTRLDAVLRANDIKRIVVAGVSTVWAVESTARDAHDRDYQVVILEDACAASTLEAHQRSIENLSMIATIVTCDPLDLLQNATSADNCCVAPVLESSRTLSTLRFCAPYTPCTCLPGASSARGLLKRL